MDDAESPEALLRAIQEGERKLLGLCRGVVGSGQPAFHTQLFGLAVARRAIGLSEGFRIMIEARNSTCAMPMVRMQLDCALRLYAGFFAKNPDAFARSVLAGVHIDKIKADDGERMRDSYLVTRVGRVNKWVPNVYRETSGFIHLSKRHITELFLNDGAAVPEDEIARRFTIGIGAVDHHRDLAAFHETLACFRHINEMIVEALDDWFTRFGTAGAAMGQFPYIKG